MLPQKWNRRFPLTLCISDCYCKTRHHLFSWQASLRGEKRGCLGVLLKFRNHITLSATRNWTAVQGAFVPISPLTAWIIKALIVEAWCATKGITCTIYEYYERHPPQRLLIFPAIGNIFFHSSILNPKHQ
jgi:hypothetical protein